MPNLLFPNPSQQSDILAAVTLLLSGATLAGPSTTVVPNNPGSTSYTYLVVAKSNGAIIPGASVSITTGQATLSSTLFNTISWSMPNPNLPTLTFDVYRTAGGASQGRIGVGLAATNVQLNSANSANPVYTFVDTGLAGDATSAPGFNTSGQMAIGIIEPEQVAAANGAITIPSGMVWLTKAGVAAMTLPLPTAGAPSAGGMDGASITVTDTTGNAHTVTTPTNGINGAKHIATFGGTAGQFGVFTAYNGSWWLQAQSGVTLT